MNIEIDFIGSKKLSARTRDYLSEFYRRAKYDDWNLEPGYYVLVEQLAVAATTASKPFDKYLPYICAIPSAPNWRPSIFSRLWWVNMFKGGYDRYYKVSLVEYGYSRGLKPTIGYYEGESSSPLLLAEKMKTALADNLKVRALIRVSKGSV